MKTNTQKIIYWTLSGLVSFILVGSATAKLSGGDQAIEMAKGLGGTTNLTILGILELLIAVLWLIPRTGVLATLLAVSYIGGAIAVHFVSNQPILVPVIIQTIIWAVAAYRFPELTKRFFNKQ
jgi:DoxX-like family